MSAETERLEVAIEELRAGFARQADDLQRLIDHLSQHTPSLRKLFAAEAAR